MIIVLAASLIVACAAAPPSAGTKLDPLTSVTLVYSALPIVLYRDDPAHAAYARNFVSLGPLLVNRSGHHEYFLWLGIWNTNQTPDMEERRDGFDSIVLFVDGEPLPLELAGWTPESIGASEPVYPKPVASSLDAYYRVTLDQIRLLANAAELQLRTSGRVPRAFEPWDNQDAARASLQRFMQQL
ncbi:MAG: hypothetical protein OEW64_06865 [Gammaproteobacteria bacterium]|nr:hypothetical protein [Gammaproteobacteria bacterium]MDH5303802.1 hypothetical protein [Gammaproteobacteria bacterium]MDH5323243.1 hypothetical protein [Gammaproteobacteria bacterium]